MGIVIPASSIVAGVQIPAKKVAAGGSGVDIAPLAYNVIDPTDGFTLEQPDAMTFSSVAHAGGTGITTFTLTGVDLNSTGSDYRFAGNGVAKWPRYYQALKDNDGTALSTDDTFIVLVKLSDFTQPSSLGYTVCVGVCLDPDAATTNAFDGYGIGHTMASTANQRKGLVAKIFLSTGQEFQYGGQDADTVFGTIDCSGTRQPGPTVYGESSGASITNGTKSVTENNAAFTSSAAWSLWVGVAPRNANQNIPGGASFACKLSYKVIRLR